MVILCLLVISVFSAETVLKDGETSINEITTDYGGYNTFIFHFGDPSEKDLFISLTTYSDYTDPDMYVRAGSKPDIDNYDFSSLSWGSGSIAIPPSKLTPNTDYYITVTCYTVCKYGLTVSFAQKIKLIDGVPIAGELSEGKQSFYEFNPVSASGNTLTITLSHITGKAKMFVVKDTEDEPYSDNTEQVEKTWDGSLEYISRDFLKNSTYKVAVMCEQDTEFNILAKASTTEATQIRASVPVRGEVATNDFTYYYIDVLSSRENIQISLTMISGDADIYVKAESLPTEKVFDFSSVHMGSEHLVISSSDRSKIGKLTGKYYIGIYGYLHGVYTLTVSTKNSSFVKLEPGNPQSGSVNLNNISYYYIDFPRVDTNISIVLSTLNGNPDLFVRLCQGKKNTCQFNLTELNNPANIYSSSHEVGSESLEIPNYQSACPLNLTCSYVIGVLGRSDFSSFILTLKTNNSDEVILQDGKPLTFVVPAGRETYFKYFVFNESVSKVDFMLTPIAGDPDLYGSLNDLVIGLNSEKSSESSGIEIDMIRWVKGVDSESLKGIYHIVAFAAEACSYSIVGKSVIPGKNTTIQIYPGHPQKDTVYNYTDQEYRIYSFPVMFSEENKQTITISLTAITGQFKLYAANNEKNLDWDKEVFYYNWMASNKNHSDPASTIIIRPDDPFYVNQSTYLILVMADKFLSDYSATYLISYSAGNGFLLLTEDVPYTGVVNKDSYSYFLFPVHYSHEDLVITLTALSGDPDMFISLDPLNPRPSNEQYDFRSTGFGDEKITVTWESGLNEKCPDLPKEYSFGQNSQCFLYISVFSLDVTTFVIRVHPSKGAPTQLILGTSLFGNISKSEYSFYYCIVDAGFDYKIMLQNDVGDSDLFLNAFDKEKGGKGIEKWTRPDKDKRMYASQSTVMSEEILVHSLDLKKYCPSGACIFTLSTYCFSKECSYFITAVQKNEIQVLKENQPTYGTADENFVYYSFYLSKDFEDFVVTVTTLNRGNPDLYISKGRTHYPNLTHFDWSSANWGADSILIKKNDSFFEGKSMKGTYIIGVRDPTGNCSFSLIVNNNIKSVQNLAQGVPQQGNMSENSQNFYVFTNYIQDDIIITLTPISGNGKLYISVFEVWTGDIYNSLPGPGNFIWSSDTSKDRYKIEITTSDKKFCTYCKIVISVVTNTQVLGFTITAKNRLNSIVLQDGVPVRLESFTGKLMLLKFEVTAKTDITISVTAYTGHPNIFVSKSKEITEKNYIRRGYYSEGIQVVSIKQKDPDFFIGTYFIVVDSYEKCSFSMVAHTSEKPISLIDGWPIYYSVPESVNEVKFKFTPLSGKRVYCYLKTLTSSKPQVYTVFSQVGSYVKPVNTTGMQKFSNESYIDYQSPESNHTSIMPMNLEHPQEKPQLNILINSNSSSFQIYCSATTHSIIARIGSLMIESLDKSLKTKQFEIITPKKGTLDVYVVPCAGSFQLNISSNWTMLTQNTPDEIVTRLTDGMLIGSINNAEGSYFASISSVKEITDYQVFQFYTVFTEAKQLVHKAFQPGKHGLIQWESLAEKKVLVSWSPVEDDLGSPVQVPVVYSVFFSEGNSENMITSCGIHYFAARQKVFLILNTEALSAEVDLPKEKGFINVIAKLARNSTSPIKEIVYDPTEVVLTQNTAGKGLLAFWVLATLLFAVVVVVIHLYQKKKRAEDRLKYELSDVRNLANVSGAELQEVRQRNP